MSHKEKICNTCWTGIHTTCTVQPFCNPEHLKQDLAIIKRHLETMNNFTLTSKVAEMVPNFTITMEDFSEKLKTIECEVLTAIKSKHDEEFNKFKDSIKE